MEYPTKTQATKAHHVKVLQWYRFLESPKTDEERDILDVIIARMKDEKILTPQLSKAVGWDD